MPPTLTPKAFTSSETHALVDCHGCEIWTYIHIPSTLPKYYTKNRNFLFGFCTAAEMKNMMQTFIDFKNDIATVKNKSEEINAEMAEAQNMAPKIKALEQKT